MLEDRDVQNSIFHSSDGSCQLIIIAGESVLSTGGVSGSYLQ